MDFRVTQWLQKILKADARLPMPIATSVGMELIAKPLGTVFVDRPGESEEIADVAMFHGWTCC